METAVVIAHPRHESYCHALAGRAITGLAAAGHTVEVLDLHADGFRAAMTADERVAYHGEQPILDPLVLLYADIVRRSRALVFVYPTWWAGLPAILKGFLERVLVPGVAFRFDERRGVVRPGLGHVRRIVGISTYGSPRWVVRLANDNGRRTLTRALRVSCGWRTRTTWMAAYGMDARPEIDRLDFAAAVERRLADLR